MVERFLDQVTKDPNFDARNDRTASGAPIRRKADERSKSEDGKTGGAGNEWQKESAPMEPHAVSHMTQIKKTELKANNID